MHDKNNNIKKRSSIEIGKNCHGTWNHHDIAMQMEMNFSWQPQNEQTFQYIEWKWIWKLYIIELFMEKQSLMTL